jgi:DNA repair exonuclease SbcCD ATPase subunit
MSKTDKFFSKTSKINANQIQKTMKSIQVILIFCSIALFSISCSNQQKKENEALKAEIALLAEQNAELAKGNMNKAQSLDHYHEMLKEIDQQLAAIDEKKQLVNNLKAEAATDDQTEEEIQMHIEHINHMMENSKHKVAQLNDQMASLRKENADQYDDLHRMDMYVNDLVDVVVQRDSEIDNLHEELIMQDIAIHALAEAYDEQAVYNEVLLDIINTGFYVAATKKELIEMGIINMEGGFIGIGRVKTLNANAPVQFLIPIDIRQADMIEIPGKKAELITPHPLESYELTYSEESKRTFLGIANKLKFWQETNYLVVEFVN